jgi:anti-sigma factor RsiW
MIDDRLQFAITQYLDGSLPSEEREELEKRLAEDAEARQLMEEYRRLDGVLRAAEPLPRINWDRLQEHLSAAVAAGAEEEGEADEAVAGRIAPPAPPSLGWMSATRRLAIAASVLLLIGAGVVAFFVLRGQTGGEPRVAVADVRVLESEAITGPSVSDVSIGPAPALAAGGDTFHDSGVVLRPSLVMIETAGQPAQDTFYQHY